MDIELKGVEGGNTPKRTLRVKTLLYILVAVVLGYVTISAIPSGVEYMSGEGSISKLDSAEGAKRALEPLTAAPQPSVEDSHGWITLIGLWSIGLLLSLGIYFIARGWRS